MKLILSLSVFLIISCNDSRTVQGPQLSNRRPLPQATPTTQARWDLNQMPLKIKIARAFNKVSYIDDMANAWETAASGEYDFFDAPFKYVPNKNYKKLDDYDDDEMGIYRSKYWFPEVGSSALAITQYFAIRRNVGTPSEYLEIVHADIITNDRDFTFSDDDPASSYDLPSIILHELGHFLGLRHNTNFLSESVMYPSLVSGVIKRVPAIEDERDILANYEAFALEAFSASAFSVDPLEGERVRGIIEHRADGECVHSVHD